MGIAIGVERRVGYDLDGTTVWREPITVDIGHAKNVLFRRRAPKGTLEDIPVLDHTPLDIPFRGINENFSAHFHFKRIGIPGMAEKIRSEVESGVPVFGISGRRATRIWHKQTVAQLVRENIPIPSTNLVLTPKGVHTYESKADAIRALGITEFNEDDIWTTRYLARLFPRVQFNYVDHGLDHLTEQELIDNPNIKVIPIEELSKVKEAPGDESAVRNSELREKTDFVDPVVRAFHRKFPKVAAWHVTAAGVIFSIAGIWLAEHQNRVGEHPHKRTAIAAGSVLLGATLDLLDGKLARTIRDEMADDEAKDIDEKKGGALDASADGVIEAAQAAISAWTSHRFGDRRAVFMALARLATTNLPRTAKAIAGSHGISVPETYGFKDVLHGDIRIFGVSLGRKIPNYLATFVNSRKSFQVGTDVVAVPANLVVTADRLGTLATSGLQGKLSNKETRHAQFRAGVLGAESLTFMGIAYFLGRRLLKKKK